MDENKKKIDDEINNMNLGPNNENQDNPYYNPYFQNTDLNSSPYFTDSNINLNNDIYTNPEPITANTDQSNMQDNTNQDNNVSIPDFNNDNIQNNNIDTPIQENNVNDDMENSSVNLFNLAQEETTNLETPIENIQPDNQMYGSDNDEEFRRVWMGNLYEKAQAKKFNWSAFFFGGFYFFYRKLYLWGFLFIVLSVLPLINNIICGLSFYSLYKSHINKTLEENKNNVQSPNQLLDIAKAKGGTSAGSAIIAVLLLFIVPVAIVAISLVNIFLISDNADRLTSGNNNNQSGGNLISTMPTENYDYHKFYNDYAIRYNPENWQLDESGKNLVNGYYSFGYMQSIENLSSFGYDISTDVGKSSFFTFLYNQFSSQIDASTTLELGSSNFSSLENGIYYSYIDLIYATSIERCYFVLIPEDNIFFEFILSNPDTVIADSIHNEIVDNISEITILDDRIFMMSNTVGENNVVEVDLNTIANNAGNSIAANENLVTESYIP